MSATNHTTNYNLPQFIGTDIPSWLADAPALTLFTRDWFDKPETIRRWVKDCWGRVAPGVPIVAASWGWEHFYTWVHPYFPCHPSDEAFTSLVADLAAACGTAAVLALYALSAAVAKYQRNGI